MLQWFRRAFRWTHRTANIVLLTVILAVLYLDFVGLPQFAVRRAIAYLRSQGLHVSIERVHLEIFDGIAVDGFRFYESGEADSPMFHVDRLILGLSPFDWLDRRPGINGLKLKGAALRIHTQGTPPIARSPQTLVLAEVDGTLGFDSAGVWVEQMTALFQGIRMRGEGYISIVRRADAEPFSLKHLSATIAETLRRLPAWLPTLAEQLNAVEYDIPPKADFDFTVYPTNPMLTRVDVRIMGYGTRVRGVDLDRWHLRTDLERGMLRIRSLTLEQGDGKCYVSGSLNFGDRMAEARIYSTLPPASWLRFVPAGWKRRASREGFDFAGAGAFELWLGPAPVERVAETVTGWASLEKVDYRGMWVEKAYAQFERAGARVELTRLDGVIGRGAQQGPIKGSAELRLDTLSYAVKVKTDFDPNAVITLLTSNQAPVIDDLEFTTPPHTRMEIAGVVTNPTAFEMAAHFSGTNFMFRGADVASFDSDVTVTHGVMTFSPLAVKRVDGTVEGAVALDFDRQKVDFDVNSRGVDPYDIARIMGSNIHAFLSGFRFEGPVRIRARGSVDYDNYDGTDLEAAVEGEKMGISWLLVDRCAFDVRAVGTKVDFTDVSGSVYGGVFEGHGAVWDIEQSNRVQYSLSGTATNLNLRQLVSATRNVDRDVYKGSVAFTATVQGVIGEGDGKTVTGGGRLWVREGSLFQIPLLGGLSQHLSKIYPGLGFITQTDFASSFQIADGKVSTSDAYLEGSILSAMGAGNYYFDERIDMVVQVKLLRQGVLAAVLRLVTLPVTKVLEFELKGTISEPVWRLHFFPKQLFLIFD